MESEDSMAFLSLCTYKHRRWTPTALIRTIPETFKGLGLSQQVAFGSTKAMLAGMVHEHLECCDWHRLYCLQF